MCTWHQPIPVVEVVAVVKAVAVIVVELNIIYPIRNKTSNHVIYLIKIIARNIVGVDQKIFQF